MKYSELLKYHENDIFIFRKGKDITINTQKILVDWYNRIPKNKRFKIKYVQRIPLILRIYKLFGSAYWHETHYIIRIYSRENSSKYIRFDTICQKYWINACSEKMEYVIDHIDTIEYVDEAQDFIRDWLNQESMDVHTLLNEFLRKPF